jgi:hypothetical protein
MGIVVDELFSDEVRIPLDFGLACYGPAAWGVGIRFEGIDLQKRVKIVRVPSEAVVNQLDNPAWSKVSRQARTELDVY